MDGHSRPTHDVDTDWDKLKQPTCEGDIGRCPILCHEEDKHHDKKSDNEPWLPVRNRRKNLGGRHVLGVPWATVIQWSTFIGNTAAGISIFFAFYSKVSRVFFAFSYKWKLFFIFIQDYLKKRMHCGAEVTESSTSKQNHLSTMAKYEKSITMELHVQTSYRHGVNY